MPEDPIATLKGRLASGEISTEQYRTILNELDTAPAADSNAASVSKTDSAPHDNQDEEDFLVILNGRYERGEITADQYREYWKNHALHARGYGVLEPKGEIIKYGKPGKDTEIIGNRNGWFSFLGTIGYLVAGYLVVVVLMSAILWLIGMDVDTAAERAPLLMTIVSWIPIVFVALLLWGRRKDYKEYERVAAIVERNVPDPPRR